MTRSALILAGAILTMTGTGVSASSESVQYGDLTLTSTAGRAELQRRVNKAVWKVCLFSDNGMLRSAEQTTDCQHDTKSEAAVRIAQLVADEQLAST